MNSFAVGCLFALTFFSSVNAGLTTHTFAHRMSDMAEHTELNTTPSGQGGGLVYAVPHGTVRFDQSIAESPFSLSGRASVDFQVDEQNLGMGETFWDRTQAAAQSQASIVDVARVFDTSGATSGTMAFSWAITGWSQLLVDSRNPNCMGDCNAVDVLNFNSSVSLTSPTLASIVPGAGGTLMEEQFDFPGSGVFPPPQSNNEIYDTTFGDASGSLVFTVPWSTGDIAVEFDLDVSLDMFVNNIDAAIFRGLIDGEYSNTAQLTGVLIRDSVGSIIPGASLQSVDGNGTPTGAVYPTSVPEPSSFCFCLVLLSAFVVPSLLARKDQTFAYE